MLSDLRASDIVIVLISILLSMVIHEAMHAFTAHWLGDTTARDEGRLTLNPAKHVDLYTTIALPLLLMIFHQPPFFVAKPVPFNPARVRHGDFGAALVGVAGPLTNLGLAIIAALFLRLDSTAIGSGLFNALYLFLQVNVGFFVFNMIPFPPLDGSRLLYAFAPPGLQEIMQRIESAGFVTILFFMLVAFQFISPLVVNIENSLITFLLR